MNTKRFWFLAYPDIPKPVGGIKQIHRLAELLESLGFRSCLVQQKATFHPQWFESSVKTVDLDQWQHLQKGLIPNQDFIVIAETFIPIIESLPSSIPVIVLIRILRTPLVFPILPILMLRRPLNSMVIILLHRFGVFQNMIDAFSMAPLMYLRINYFF